MKNVKDTAATVRVLLSKINKKIKATTGAAKEYWTSFYQECVEWLEANVEIGTKKIITLSETAYVRIREREFGFKVIKVYNNGDNVGRTFSYKTYKAALKKANSIKDEYCY